MGYWKGSLMLKPISIIVKMNSLKDRGYERNVCYETQWIEIGDILQFLLLSLKAITYQLFSRDDMFVLKVNPY